jgi:mRNA interferase RelE/StbE
MSYELFYSETSREQIRLLHLDLKPLIKSKTEALKENPFLCKFLEQELSGYLSLRVRRFRIIYRIVKEIKAVEIHYIGHRKDIYEIFRDRIR